MQVDWMPLRNQPDDARGILSHTVVFGAIAAPIPIQAGKLGLDHGSINSPTLAFIGTDRSG
jgi:hypothetical protein